MPKQPGIFDHEQGDGQGDPWAEDYGVGEDKGALAAARNWAETNAKKQAADLWGDREYGAARRPIVWGNRSGDQRKIITLAETKRATLNVVRVFKPSIRDFTYKGNKGGANLPGTDTILVTARPVLNAIDLKQRASDMKASQDVIIGIALHEAGHAMATPKDFFDKVDQLRTLMKLKMGGTAFRAIAAAVEDNFVEAVVLHPCPGYRHYIRKAWRWHKPDGALNDLTAVHQDGWSMKTAYPLMVELTRRYEPLSPLERQGLLALEEHQRAWLLAAQLILGRARDHALTPSDRYQLIAELALLVVTGDVPKRDQETLRRSRVTPPGRPPSPKEQERDQQDKEKQARQEAAKQGQPAQGQDDDEPGDDQAPTEAGQGEADDETGDEAGDAGEGDSGDEAGDDDETGEDAEGEGEGPSGDHDDDDEADDEDEADDVDGETPGGLRRASRPDTADDEADGDEADQADQADGDEADGEDEGEFVDDVPNPTPDELEDLAREIRDTTDKILEEDLVDRIGEWDKNEDEAGENIVKGVDAEIALDREKTTVDWEGEVQGSNDMIIITPRKEIIYDPTSKYDLFEDPGQAYREALADVRPALPATRRAMTLRNQEYEERDHRLDRGKLEGRALPAARAQVRAGLTPTPFSDLRTRTPEKTLILFCTDASGSMVGDGANGIPRVYPHSIRAMALVEAAVRQANHESLAFAAYAHTTEGPYGPTMKGVVLRLMNKTLRDPERLGIAQALATNLDAEALKYVIDDAAGQYPGYRRVTFVISDGLPHTVIVGDPMARIAHLIKRERLTGHVTTCFFLGPKLLDRQAQTLTRGYGQQGVGWHHVADARALPAVIQRIFRKQVLT